MFGGYSYSGGQATDGGASTSANAYKAVHSDYVGYLRTRDAWQAIIGAAVTAFALMKQSEQIDRQVAVMERAQGVAESYLALSQSNYNNIAVPTFTRQRDLFDTGVSCFAQISCTYLNDSQLLKTYTPEYNVQMGRSIAAVQQSFDRAAQQRSRAIGRYSSGRCCDDATRFAINRAIATAGAINHGYRFEEDRKRKLDAWYWERQSQGASFLTNWRGQVISGLNQGANVAIAGLGAVGNAVTASQNAAAGVAQAYGNAAQFWGGVAQLGMAMGGFATGKGGEGRTLGGSSGFSGSMSLGSANSLPNSNAGGGVFSPGFDSATALTTGVV